MSADVLILPILRSGRSRPDAPKPTMCVQCAVDHPDFAALVQLANRFHGGDIGKAASALLTEAIHDECARRDL